MHTKLYSTRLMVRLLYDYSVSKQPYEGSYPLTDRASCAADLTPWITFRNMVHYFNYYGIIRIVHGAITDDIGRPCDDTNHRYRSDHTI